MSHLLTIGADPEFVIARRVQPGALPTLVRAEDYFASSGPLGIDGAGGIVEIRPRPSPDILEVAESVTLIMQAADTIVPKEMEFFAGAFVCGRPIGGHIHFGGFHEMSPRLELVLSNLDFISSCFYSGIEPTNQVRRRRTRNYGRLGQYRSQAHGIEYRSPLSWLLSPAVTIMYLGYMKLAVVQGVSGLDFRRLPGSNRPGITFLKNLPNYTKMPMDCLSAMEIAQPLLKARPRMNWDVDMRPMWREPVEGEANASIAVSSVSPGVPNQQP